MAAARIELRATTTLVGFSSAHSKWQTPIADQCDVLWRLVGARGEITIGESLNSEHAAIKTGTKTREQRSQSPASGPAAWQKGPPLFSAQRPPQRTAAERLSRR